MLVGWSHLPSHVLVGWSINLHTYSSVPAEVIQGMDSRIECDGCVAVEHEQVVHLDVCQLMVFERPPRPMETAGTAISLHVLSPCLLVRAPRLQSSFSRLNDWKTNGLPWTVGMISHLCVQVSHDMLWRLRQHLPLNLIMH